MLKIIIKTIVLTGMVSILSVVAMAGNITNPTPKTAKELVKFNNGNKWVYSITQTSSVDNAPKSEKTNNYTSTTMVVKSVKGKSATYSTDTTQPGTPVVDSTNYFDAKGNMLVDVPMAQIKGTIAYPAQIYVGATWDAPIPFVEGAKVTSTVTAIDATYTGPAGTFTNLVKIEQTSKSHVTMFGTTMTINQTGYQLVSPAIGSTVYETSTNTTYAGQNGTTIVTTKVLQPGYIAK